MAMIESITEDGQVIVTDGWATNTTSCPNDWSCINFRSRTYNSLEEFYDYVQYNNGNVFLGYIYLLG